MARHQEPDFRDRLEYFGLTLVLKLLRFPNYRRARSWGETLGRTVDRLLALRKDVALANLRQAFPEWEEAQRAAVYSKMCENLGLLLVDFARMERPSEPVSQSIKIQNPDAFSEAKKTGVGALLLTAHFGNWEALGAAAVEEGYPVTMLGARQRNPLVEDLFDRLRRNRGAKTITVGKTLRPVLAALNRGDFVASLADQDGGPDGFFIEFLGREASVQAGLFRLAVRRGIPLVTGFAVRDGERWRGELQSPEWPRPTSGDAEVESEARRLAALYTRRVEDYIRRYPDHWFWVHRRWKTRPQSDRPQEPSPTG